MNIVLGVDEVGRGCWAGPLVAGAVVLPGMIPGLRDSKKLSASQRSKLAEQIYLLAAGWGLGWVTPAEVDRLGMTAAVRTAMVRAVAQVACEYDEIVIDGSYNFLDGCAPAGAEVRTLIGADNIVPAASAASIIAKVARDAYMHQMAKEFPGYGFEKHVGYGTARHVQALQTLGPCELHRMSFKPLKVLQSGGVGD